MARNRFGIVELKGRHYAFFLVWLWCGSGLAPGWHYGASLRNRALYWAVREFRVRHEGAAELSIAGYLA